MKQVFVSQSLIEVEMRKEWLEQKRNKRAEIKGVGSLFLTRAGNPACELAARYPQVLGEDDRSRSRPQHDG